MERFPKQSQTIDALGGLSKPRCTNDNCHSYEGGLGYRELARSKPFRLGRERMIHNWKRCFFACTPRSEKVRVAGNDYQDWKFGVQQKRATTQLKIYSRSRELFQNF